MPAIETSIWLALRGRVEALVLSPVLPLLWPGESETLPQAGTPPRPVNCLEVIHLPNRTERMFVGSDDDHRYQGILQVAVLTIPGAADHENLAREIAGKVVAHFPADLKLQYAGVQLRITKRPDTRQSFRDTARSRWLTPISIYYQAFA